MQQSSIFRTLFIGILAFIILLNSACTKVNGDGPVVTETRSTGNFNGVHYALHGSLYVESSNQTSIEIKAQKNIINVIETYIQDGQLNIRLKPNTIIHSYESIEVYVKCPEPATVALSGSGNIWVNGIIKTRNLMVESSGSGDIHFEKIDADKMDARISGSGKIEVLTGSTGKQNIYISGSGKLESAGLNADSVFTRTSGSGDITIWANTYLESEISGSGVVRYKGNPIIRQKISGSGKLVPLN